MSPDQDLRYKDMLQDIVLLRRHCADGDTWKYKEILTPGRAVPRTLPKLADLDLEIGRSRGRFTIDISQPQREFIQAYYSNVPGCVEMLGYRLRREPVRCLCSERSSLFWQRCRT